VGGPYSRAAIFFRARFKILLLPGRSRFNRIIRDSRVEIETRIGAAPSSLLQWRVRNPSGRCGHYHGDGTPHSMSRRGSSRQFAIQTCPTPPPQCSSQCSSSEAGLAPGRQENRVVRARAVRIKKWVKSHGLIPCRNGRRDHVGARAVIIGAGITANRPT